MSWVRTGVTSSLLLSCLLIIRPGAHAQESDSLPPVTFGGFVDSYFSWNTARPASHINRFRNFDLSSEQFILSEAQVDIGRRAAPIGFHIALNTGTASDIIHTGSTSTMNLLMQGFVSFVLPLGTGLTLDAGKFVTHMGFETINAKDNYNYSRSFLFAWAIPYYHIGLRAAYPLLKELTLGACISNGWNAAATSDRKTFGGTLSYTPLPVVSLTANWIGGPGQADSAHSGFRHVAEITTLFQVSSLLTLAADLIYGRERTPETPATWKGAALYGRYALTDYSIISVRGEVYDDPSGFTTGIIQTLKEITLTYEYKVLQNLLMRFEYRHDRSSAGVFDGSAGDATRSQQNTCAVSGIVTF